MRKDVGMDVGAVVRGMIEPRRGESHESVSAFADRTGLAASTWYGYASGDRDLPAGLVPMLTLAKGDTALIEALCVACGGVFRPRVVGADAEEVLVRQIGALHRESGECLAVIGEALADGRLSAGELARCTRELQDVMQQLVSLEAHLVGMHASSGAGKIVSLQQADAVGAPGAAVASRRRDR